MNKIVELPLIEPMYQTYHDGITTACLKSNPSIRNWFLSNTMILTCSKRFLSGYTSPEIRIENYSFDSPLFEKKYVSMEFLNGYLNPVIRNMIDAGYYVYFAGIDDYYVKGKSWYRERHFNHDGVICGYNRLDKTFLIYAYDSNWICQKFWTPQKAFDRGREAMFKKGLCGFICGIKPIKDQIEFSLEEALKGISDYLDSDMIKYPEDGDGLVRGIAVHEYIAKYIDRLIDGSIPYSRMDRRVFRLIWEHKNVMLERIKKIEQLLGFGNRMSEEYKPIVSSANLTRMLYASYHLKRRDSLLPLIKEKLLKLEKDEKRLLKSLIAEAGDKQNDRAVENTEDRN